MSDTQEETVRAEVMAASISYLLGNGSMRVHRRGDIVEMPRGEYEQRRRARQVRPAPEPRKVKAPEADVPEADVPETDAPEAPEAPEADAPKADVPEAPEPKKKGGK